MPPKRSGVKDSISKVDEVIVEQQPSVSVFTLWFSTLVITCVTLIVYFSTLHPSVAGGDSGELMCVAHEVGTPHPPGYPTFAMYTKAAEVIVRFLEEKTGLGWAALPGGREVTSITTRQLIPLAIVQNGAHAFLSALGVGMLFATAVELTSSLACGVAAAGVFAFAPNVWTYAVSTEVFPLNNLFTGLLLLLAVQYGNHLKYRKSFSSFRLRFSAFFCGLALTNQHTLVLFVAPIVLWVLVGQVRSIKQLLVLSVLFFMGMLPYLYLPWSSTYVITTNSWGQLNTWDGFWHHFLRKEYGTFSLASQEANYRVANFQRAWKYYLYDIGEQTFFCVWPLAVVGVASILAFCFRVFSFKSISAWKRLLGNTELILLLTWLLYCNFFNFLSNLPIDKPLFYGVQQRFWIQPLMIISLFIAVGMRDASAFLCSFFGKSTTKKAIITGLTAALAVGIFGAQVWMHFGARDETDNYYVRDFGVAILKPLPNNSIVLTKGDIMINAARYVQVIEGFRPDVILLDQELLTYPWYNRLAKQRFPQVKFPGDYYFPNRPKTYDMASFLKANFATKGRRIFLAYGWKEHDYSHQDLYDARPFGVIQEVISKPTFVRQRNYQPKNEEKSLPQDFVVLSKELQSSLPTMKDHRVPPAGRYSDISWEHVVTSDFRQALINNAFELMNIGEKLAAIPTLQLNVAKFRGAINSVPMRVELVEPCLTTNDPNEIVLCGLILAGGRFEATLDPNYWPVKPPKLVRRNLSVVFQTLLRFDPNNKHLKTRMRDTLTQHLEEIQGDKEYEKDRANLQAVIEHYANQL